MSPLEIGVVYVALRMSSLRIGVVYVPLRMSPLRIGVVYAALRMSSLEIGVTHAGVRMRHRRRWEPPDPGGMSPVRSAVSSEEVRKAHASAAMTPILGRLTPLPTRRSPVPCAMSPKSGGFAHGALFLCRPGNGIFRQPAS